MKLSFASLRVHLAVNILIRAIFWGGTACQAQSSANLSSAAQEVVKLNKAQVGDEVIISYINKSSTTVNLSADDIVYLKDQGVSQSVISALLKAQPLSPAPVENAPPAPAPQPAPSAVAPPPGPAPMAPGPEINFNYFHDQLAPFGAWIDVGGTMYWRPDAALRANPDWRPYYDMGHWTQTENGLFWQSDYGWGDIPFHYGRWIRHPALGWLWAPDYTWGPAWVFWRHAEADGAIGWAPLPVGAVFVGGAFMYHGTRVGVDFDFGLGEGVFVFVSYDHFHEPFFRMHGREYAWHIHGDRFHDYYRRSVLRNEFRRDEHGRFVNEGIGHERMQQFTHGRVEHASFQERRPVGDRATLSHSPAPAGGKAGEKPGQPAAGKPAAEAPSKVFRPPRASPTENCGAETTHEGGGQTEGETMKKMYRAIGVAVVLLELGVTTGCQSPNGQPNNTGTGALVGGLFGAAVGGLAGGHHAGQNALIGGLAGAMVGGMIGHSIDRDQQHRLRAQSPQTLQTIQHNDLVYEQQQQVVQTPAPVTVPSAQSVGKTSPTPVMAPPAEALIPLTVDDIKALDAAGVKKEVIVSEIARSKSVYTQADIAALQQVDPNIDPAIIECMKKTGSS